MSSPEHHEEVKSQSCRCKTQCGTDNNIHILQGVAGHHDGKGLFSGLANPFNATRYHSLVVERSSLPDCLEINAWVEEGEIMGLRHRELPVWGVQFHPESILTVEGKRLLQNFLDLT